MYWFQEIESARALARLWSESPHPPRDDGAPQSNPDQLPLLAYAGALTPLYALDDVAPGSHEDASVTPCPVR